MAVDTEKVRLQVELIKRMRLVRDTLPRWASYEAIQAAQAADPECQRLLAEADAAWAA